jgi:hypothetical protein
MLKYVVYIATIILSRELKYRSTYIYHLYRSVMRAINNVRVIAFAFHVIQVFVK